MMHEPIAALRAMLDAAPRQQHVLHRDFETRALVSLKAVGAHRYAAAPGTEIICAAFALDGQPPKLWLPGDPVPAEFVEAACNPDWTVAAHGDHFEAAIEQHILGPRTASR